MRERAPIAPRVRAPLDPDFRPAVLVNRSFTERLGGSGVPLLIGLERGANELSRFQLSIFPDDHPEFEENLPYVERIVKFLLWQRGGYRLYVGGSGRIAAYLAETYSPNGARNFDHRFMGEQVYEREFSVVGCRIEDVPPVLEAGKPLGRHLQGCRIGFDLGASDRKASAVVDGTAVYSEEIPWEPRNNTDPEYHYREILAALKSAASRLPRVDAIGGSSAGIYIDNRPMVASLFRGVPAERYGEVRNLFLRIREELGVPLEVINDGDVTALAGSMSIEDNAILGIAMGSSEAAGYVDAQGHILGWLNELAFAPVDYNPEGPVEEWSGDRGCGASYYSQQCVFRLAPRAGIEIPGGLMDVDRLAFVQQRLEAGEADARSIWETMGTYLGYGVAHYADFYDIKHVLILGRCTSGAGGPILLEGAREVLRREFPELMQRITLHLPDEKVRRVGQSVAAASLPAVDAPAGALLSK
jgi:predicted NBD/HSP70 family sugar kinase